MRIKQEFILREIAGEYILVPIGTTALDFNGLITVNEVGALIWKCLLEEKTFDEIVASILNEYEIDEQTASEDVLEFIKYLQNNNIVEGND